MYKQFCDVVAVTKESKYNILLPQFPPPPTIRYSFVPLKIIHLPTVIIHLIKLPHFNNKNKNEL